MTRWFPIVLLAAAAAGAGGAPAPDPGRLPRARFEALKKRLPRLVEAWVKERWAQEANAPPVGNPRYSSEVRLARLVGPAEAKVTVLLPISSGGRRVAWADQVLTVYLRYHEGRWTTTGFDASWPTANTASNRTVRFLLLAIDESQEK
jgi:hypothetical protein